MFRKLHFKLTVYMGIILIIFMFFVATGIYSFTRIVFEDGNKEIMESEALRIYTYRNLASSGFIIKDSPLFQRIGPSVELNGTQRLDVCYVIYNDKNERIFTEENEITIADDIQALAEKSFEEQKDSFVKERVGQYNYRIYTKYFYDIN
ncbi:MAG: hypothetical protein ACERLG_13050, partial [Sedimentibacter sp.]